MDRRDAFQKLTAVLGSGAWMLASCTTQSVRSGSSNAPAAFGGRGASDPDVARLRQELARLRQELARLEAREYSEEGIPMFLACENLADAETGTSRGNAPFPANAALAAAFERYVVLMPEFRPFASEHDVAKLVELLAAQDFAREPGSASGGSRSGSGVPDCEAP